MSKPKRKTSAGRRQSTTPVFDALMMEAQQTPHEDLISTDELARRLGITEQERAEARTRIEQWAPDEPDNTEAQEHVAQERNGADGNPRVPKPRAAARKKK